MKFLTSRAASGCNVSCGVLRPVEVLFWSQMGHEMDTESYRLLLCVTCIVIFIKCFNFVASHTVFLHLWTTLPSDGRDCILVTLE